MKFPWRQRQVWGQGRYQFEISTELDVCWAPRRYRRIGLFTDSAENVSPLVSKLTVQNMQLITIV